MAAAIIGIAVLVGGLYVIAKAEGVDVGAQLSDLGESLSSDVSNLASSVTGGGDDTALSIAKRIVKGFEGFSARRYPDPPGSGKFSIGYGHSIQPGEPYDENYVMSEDEADGLLGVDLGGAYADVQNSVTVDLSPQQTAALISFTYNEGGEAFRTSTLLQKVNEGDFEGAAAEFPKWIYEHVNGQLQVSEDLKTRRAQEQELFNS